MLGQFQEGLGDACYVRSNPRGSWRHLLCQVKSQRVLKMLVMLGPISQGQGDTCYVRCNPKVLWRPLLCQVQSGRVLETLVMLGTNHEGLLTFVLVMVFRFKILGYFQSSLKVLQVNLEKIVMLGPFLGTIVMLGHFWQQLLCQVQF